MVDRKCGAMKYGIISPAMLAIAGDFHRYITEALAHGRNLSHLLFILRAGR